MIHPHLKNLFSFFPPKDPRYDCFTSKIPPPPSFDSQTQMDEDSQHPAKRRRISLDGEAIASHLYNRPIQSPIQNTYRESESSSSLSQDFFIRDQPEGDGKCSNTTITKFTGQTIAPFLARHIPAQYAPLGGSENSKDSAVNENPNTRYCYRHRPDLKCRRQVNEPSMDQLQHVSCLLSINKHMGHPLIHSRNSKPSRRQTSKASLTYGLSSPLPLPSTEILSSKAFLPNVASPNYPISPQASET